MRVGIIGAGNIGSELFKRVKQLRWDVLFVLKSDGVYKNLTEKVDVGNYQKYIYQKYIRTGVLDAVFLAIPTLDDGKVAFDYLSFYLPHNIPVITCEKGALSNYFSELEKWLDNIGYGATVGGGTRLLMYAKEMISNNTLEIHAVINGTLNYIFDEISRGRTLGEVTSEAKRMGYAEPGAEDPLDIINRESVEDVPMKTAILFNVCSFSSEVIKGKEIVARKIKERDLKKLIRESCKRRFVVSIRKGNKNQNDNIGGFSHEVGEWTISGGFIDITANSTFRELVPHGVNNAIIICEGKYRVDGIYRLSGQGAGAGPTVSSMIKDVFCLVK